MYLSNLIIKPASTTHDVLTATSVESATETTSPVISQVHALTPTGAESASETSSPSLSQTHALTVTSVESASQVSQPTAADIPSGADHNLFADDVESASDVTAPALAQVHVLAATDVESLSSVDSPSLAQIQALLATGVECATVLSEPTVVDSGSISNADIYNLLLTLQTEIGLIKSKTDSLTFTVPGQVDSNLKSIADTANSTQLTDCTTATGFATVNPDNAGIAAAQTAAESADIKATDILADTADIQPRVADMHNADGLDPADPVTISGDGQNSSTITTTRLVKTITPTSINRTS